MADRSGAKEAADESPDVDGLADADAQELADVEDDVGRGTGRARAERRIRMSVWLAPRDVRALRRLKRDLDRAGSDVLRDGLRRTYLEMYGRPA